MKKNQRHKELIYFLKEEKCLGNFIFNCKSLTKAFPIDKRNIILGAFIWCFTKEGHAFWSLINNKWLHSCSSEKINEEINEEKVRFMFF
jgi:hypothetical protein